MQDLQILEADRRAEYERQVSIEGPLAASREAYNLSAILVQQQKWTEAEPLLRELLKDLQERETGRETTNFILQEAATMRLLGSSLVGLGREEEGRRFIGDAEVMERQAEN